MKTEIMKWDEEVELNVAYSAVLVMLKLHAWTNQNIKIIPTFYNKVVWMTWRTRDMLRMAFNC